MFKMKFTKPDILLFNAKASKEMFDSEGRKFMNRALVKLLNDIVALTPVGATGDLRNSLAFKIFVLKDMIRGLLFAGKKYAIVVNDGRKAAPVSMTGQKSLVRWVQKSSAGRSLWTSLKSKYPKITARQVAFLVARRKKMQKTAGQKFFDKGIKNAKQDVKNIFRIFSKVLRTRLMSA